MPQSVDPTCSKRPRLSNPVFPLLLAAVVAAATLLSGPSCADREEAAQTHESDNEDLLNGPLPDPPELVYEEPVEIPPASYQPGFEARVVLRMLVDTLGEVTDVRVFRTCGLPSLDTAAYKAAWKSKYQPARIVDSAFAVWVTKVIRIRPHD